MIKVVTAEPSHAWAIVPKQVYLDNPNVRKETAEAIMYSYAVTVMDKNLEMLAIIGCQLLHPRTAEFWALTSPLCEKYPIAFHKKALAMLDVYAQENGLQRAQMVVREDYNCGKRWAESLGFTSEGVLRKYGPEGADYVMFGRIF